MYNTACLSWRVKLFRCSSDLGVKKWALRRHSKNHVSTGNLGRLNRASKTTRILTRVAVAFGNGKANGRGDLPRSRRGGQGTRRSRFEPPTSPQCYLVARGSLLRACARPSEGRGPVHVEPRKRPMTAQSAVIVGLLGLERRVIRGLR